MTEKQIEKMKKYVELIRDTSMTRGIYYSIMSYEDGDIEMKHYADLLHKYKVLGDYLITRMEREMKR